MSRKYKHGDHVPNEVLAKRLDELVDVITKGGPDAVRREFVMRVSAELDHCPDLVMSQAAQRLRAQQSPVTGELMDKQIEQAWQRHCEFHAQENPNYSDFMAGIRAATGEGEG